MRIIIVTPGMHSPWVDGRITSLKVLAEAWVANGAEVLVHTTSSAVPPPNSTFQDKGVTYRLHPGGNRRNWLNWACVFWNCCSRREWDLVIYRPFAGWNRTNLLGILMFRVISLLKRVPFALSLWSGPAELLKVPWLFSVLLVTGIRPAGTSGRSGVVFIPPLIEVSRKTSQAPHRKALAQGGIGEQDRIFLFTYCGKVATDALWRYVMEKRGLFDLIQAAAELRDLQHLKILVSMPMLAQEEARQHLEVLLEARGVRALFVLTGELKHRDEVLSAVDAYLYPVNLDEVSWAPLSALEALACGTPVITTRTKAILQCLTEEDALLYEPGQVAVLAQHMRRLLSDPDLVGRLKERAKLRTEIYDSRGKSAGEILATLPNRNGPIMSGGRWWRQ